MKTNWELVGKIRALSDGKRTSAEIAAILGIVPRRVRKAWTRHQMPRPREGGQRNQRNHQFAGGRRIGKDGYVKITPPEGHQTAKTRPGRIAGYMAEHRYVMEQKLGRLLLSQEIVDHIDGLTLHNHPDNLRLFASNADHLRATISGQKKNMSDEGRGRLSAKHRQLEPRIPVDIHRQRKKSGAIRMRQILLAALKLGKDSPYLLGNSLHTTKAEIDLSSRSTIERALADLCQRWAWDRTPSQPKCRPQDNPPGRLSDEPMRPTA